MAFAGSSMFCRILIKFHSDVLKPSSCNSCDSTELSLQSTVVQLYNVDTVTSVSCKYWVVTATNQGKMPASCDKMLIQLACLSFVKLKPAH